MLDCNENLEGTDYYCDRPVGHEGDHFGGNAGGAGAEWPQTKPAQPVELDTVAMKYVQATDSPPEDS